MYKLIAQKLGFSEQQVAAVISLLKEGATIPFIARYRKERTGALDEVQLKCLEEIIRNYVLACTHRESNAEV